MAQKAANDLKADSADANSAVIGTELVCPSIAPGGDGTAETAVPYQSANPHLRFFSDRRGYTLTTIGRTEVRADFRVVPKVTEHGSAATTAQSFVILDGRPGLEEL